MSFNVFGDERATIAKPRGACPETMRLGILVYNHNRNNNDNNRNRSNSNNITTITTTTTPTIRNTQSTISNSKYLKNMNKLKNNPPIVENKTTWVFPQIVGKPPKSMVYNGKPDFKMDDLGGPPLYNCSLPPRHTTTRDAVCASQPGN